jgi:hypothetical protein
MGYIISNSKPLQKVNFSIQEQLFDTASRPMSSPFDENHIIMTMMRFAHQLYLLLWFSLYFVIVFLTSNMWTEEWNIHITFWTHSILLVVDKIVYAMIVICCLATRYSVMWINRTSLIQNLLVQTFISVPRILSINNAKKSWIIRIIYWIIQSFPLQTQLKPHIFKPKIPEKRRK